MLLWKKPIWRVQSLSGLKASTKITPPDPQEGWSQVLNRGPRNAPKSVKRRGLGIGLGVGVGRRWFLTNVKPNQMSLKSTYRRSRAWAPVVSVVLSGCLWAVLGLGLQIYNVFCIPSMWSSKQMCQKPLRWLLPCITPLMEPIWFLPASCSAALGPSTSLISQSCSQAVSQPSTRYSHFCIKSSSTWVHTQSQLSRPENPSP